MCLKFNINAGFPERKPEISLVQQLSAVRAARIAVDTLYRATDAVPPSELLDILDAAARTFDALVSATAGFDGKTDDSHAGLTIMHTGADSGFAASFDFYHVQRRVNESSDEYWWDKADQLPFAAADLCLAAAIEKALKKVEAAK